MTGISAANLDSAKLSFYRAKGQGSIKGMLYTITGAWDPNTITWSTKPATQSTAISTYSIPSTLKIWIPFNVTSAIKNMLAGSLANNGFMMALEDNSGVEVICTSSEGAIATNRPKLTLYYSKTSTPNALERKQNPVSIVSDGKYLTAYTNNSENAVVRLFTIQGREVSRQLSVRCGERLPVPFSNGAFVAKVNSPSALHVEAILIKK